MCGCGSGGRRAWVAVGLGWQRGVGGKVLRYEKVPFWWNLLVFLVIGTWVLLLLLIVVFVCMLLIVVVMIIVISSLLSIN